MRASRILIAVLLGLAGATVAACAGVSSDSSDEDVGALQGPARPGGVVKTAANLRLRRTPSQKDNSNVITVLPKGTEVILQTGTPVSGFYEVRLLSSDLARRLKADRGFVFGKYLNGEAQEPEAYDAGAYPVPDADYSRGYAQRELKVKVMGKDCSNVRDDRGFAMAPTLDDFVASGRALQDIPLGIDVAAFPYGSRATIYELTFPHESLVPALEGVTFKVVPINAQKDLPVATVTLCAKSSALLPPAGATLTLTVDAPL